MFFLQQFAPESGEYNVPVSLRMRGPLRVAALKQALNRIVQRHEVLRTHFAMRDEQPVQVIEPALTLDLPVVDLRPLPYPQDVEQRILARETRRPFDLLHGPLLRALLLRLGDEEHRLTLCLHHVASDAWSMDVLGRELAALYEASCTGRPAALPELPIQYADYALWQRDRLQGEVLEQQLQYWRATLANAPGLDLPTRGPRPTMQTHAGAWHLFRLSPDLTQALRQLTQREGVTLFITMLAAWNILLQRYSGQSDILVGTPISGRNRAELEGLIGLFLNTMVLRTDLSGNPTFLEFLARVRETALAAYAHQELPFEKLVQELQPQRDLSRAALFQVMLVVLPEAPLRRWRMAGLELEPARVDSTSVKFDLALSMNQDGGGMNSVLRYRNDLFEPSLIAAMAEHFERLLKQIAAHPEQRIGDLHLLSEAERHRQIVEWNDTASEHADESSVHELFEQQAERTPDAPAVLYERQQLSYCEINLRANQLAHYLRALGVGPEVRVAIHCRRNPSMVIAVLATLKAGGTYLPLDAAWPRERLAMMIDDAQPRVLLSESSLSGARPACAAHLVRLDSDFALWSSYPNRNLPWRSSPQTAAYIIYTSGSTGRPKGVVIEHRQIRNYMLGVSERAAFPPAARYAMLQPLTVDSSATVLYAALCQGGCLQLIPESTATDAAALMAYWKTEPPDCLKIAPSHLAALQAGADARHFVPRRRLIVGGEASAQAWLESVQALAPECVIFNHYGPTETTVGVLMHRLPAGTTEEPSGMAPLGRPMPNIRTYVLDRSSQPVPVGVKGELYIGGAGVGRGYLNRPALTAERFLPDQFSPEPGARCYRSGDLACYRTDGSVQYLGRGDDQVKIRGYRVELGEIEALLARQAGVRECAVAARESGVGGVRLVGYVVWEVGTHGSVRQLRESLQKQLPEYMLPSQWVELPQLPLSAHGKLDRRALPAPPDDAPNGQSYVAPGTPIEEVLAGIWTELLRVEHLGVNDNFFELGGHSLLAMRLVSRIRDTLQVDVPLQQIFAAPTVAGLAKVVLTHEPRPGQTEKIARILKRIAEDGLLARQAAKG
jgi:amino acid adenylation domain-containing protein